MRVLMGLAPLNALGKMLFARSEVMDFEDSSQGAYRQGGNALLYWS
jgi:hypothetical protein